MRLGVAGLCLHILPGLQMEVGSQTSLWQLKAERAWKVSPGACRQDTNSRWFVKVCSTDTTTHFPFPGKGMEDDYPGGGGGVCVPMPLVFQFKAACLGPLFLGVNPIECTLSNLTSFSRVAFAATLHMWMWEEGDRENLLTGVSGQSCHF